jgi:hypothetical protein
MATPPSLRKERVAQTGLQICQPCGPVTGDKPQETLVSALRLTRMRKAGSRLPVLCSPSVRDIRRSGYPGYQCRSDSISTPWQCHYILTFRIGWTFSKTSTNRREHVSQ